MTNSNLWFWKRNGQVSGPFPAGQLQKYILLKRMTADDEVSQDKMTWRKVATVRAIIPEVFRHKNDENYQERLDAAIRWADDRTVERESKGGKHYLSHKQLTHLDISFFDWKMTLLFFFLIALIFYAAFYFMPPNKTTVAKNCDEVPQAGRDYSHCKKKGVDFSALNLVDTNFSNAVLIKANFFKSNLQSAQFKYSQLVQVNFKQANLQQANLTGANLKKAKLNNADFSGADLSYADLTGASAVNTRFNGTKFDKTVWFDGQICEKGSIGKCLIQK